MIDFELRAEFGFPPKIDDFFGGIQRTGAPHEPGWDYHLWVEEWAEAYLGSEQFASLERRFGSTPGVSKVAHIDREVFVIKSRLNAEQLRELLWPHFVTAARAGVAGDA